MNLQNYYWYFQSGLSKDFCENLIKFGNSNNLQERVDIHKKTYDNFILYNVFKVSNKIQIENAIKNHSILKKKKNVLLGLKIRHNLGFKQYWITPKI
jgi:hypothetical protein